ncbi:MAG: Agmatine deiminase (EC [uncultured Sulfurovum sp.]|uniref:Agmatine deiminase (EC) n=1 Tax=uncultured Sulfurovum sp. TaxID=269237 RepID=A0A6S6S2K1_9BACT|nr:MAG: Agmatine deiminase (EC [uncultured Sulfurovum sp.]
MMKHLPPEWQKQRAVLMAFPHKNSDWADDLKSALVPFIRTAQAIAYTTPVYIICDNKEEISNLFCYPRNLSFIEIETNDTWIRDFGYISVVEDGEVKLLDFTFDAWGGKFDAELDNEVNKVLHKKGYMGVTPLESINFVLEGGSIESDGEGTILTTTACLCNPNRNGGLSKDEVAKKLEEYFGAKRVLWLDYGYLAGDDTDSHIDTLARFVSTDTIMYVQCLDEEDEHYGALKKMEDELKEFKDNEGKFYNLLPLPLPSAKYDEEKNRLPATYVNFLITNGALVYPTYSVVEDKIADAVFKDFFKDKEIIPVECSRLIEEGGSLHCSTMQVPF